MTAQLGGLQGYSSPNKEHILFSPDAGRDDYVRGVLESHRVWYIEGTGRYKGGEPECTFAVEYQPFWSMFDVLKPALKEQESFLSLGTLQSMNWRPAQLIYQEFNGGLFPTENIGTWHEVANVRGLKDWSEFNGRYYTVKKNPARTPEDERERATAQLVNDLREVLIDTIGPIMNQKQGIVEQRAAEWLKGKTLMNGEVIG